MKRMLAVLIPLILALVWWGRPKAPTPDSSATPEVVVKVHWTRAVSQSLAEQTVAQGTVTPLRQATLSAVQGGVIESMRLWKNQRVSAGQLLVSLNLLDLSAQRNETQALVREAQVNLANLQNGSNAMAQATAEKDLRQTEATRRTAQALYNRRRQLFDQGGVSLKDLQDAQLAANVASSNFDLSQRSYQLLQKATKPGSLALARVKLEEAQLRVATLDSPLRFAELRAPISGTVTDQFQFLGEYVAPGTKLLSLADLSEVIVRGQFPDTVMARLEVGQSASVRPLDRPQLRLKGRITSLGAVTDPQNRAGEVWVQLHNSDGKLRSGGFCEITVSTGHHPAVVVPDAALTLDQPESKNGWLAVVDDRQVAHRRQVVCGLHQGGQTEVVSGLRAGELVVTQGNYGLADGTKVSQ